MAAGTGRRLREYATLFILAGLVLAASMVSADFFTAPNLSNISRQIAGFGIMSMLIPGHGLGMGLMAGLGTGLACGLINGLLIANYRLSPFVVTLAMMTVARGLALMASHGAPILVDETGALLLDFGRATLLHIPLPTALMLLVFCAGALFLGWTRPGRIVRAVGSNEEAVRLSGVPVGRHVLLTYLVSGALASVAGIISTARAGVGAPTVGVGDELTVIAAVVIGGASLAGGRGNVLNTLVGVVILGVIANIMNLASVPGYHQQVVMGVIILAAILVQRGTVATRR